MTAPQTDATTDPRSIITALQQRLDTALVSEATLAEALVTRTAELATRNSEFGERIEHQSATIDVLKAMSASPGDAQPVFDLIVRRAQELCNGAVTALLEYDGQLVRFRSEYGSLQHIAPDVLQAYKNQYPLAPTPTLNSHRALLEKRIIHVRDMDAEPEANDAARVMGWGSEVQVPLLRGGESVGVMALASTQKGGFSDSQVELLKTFAEQAVIAITSAETYRALQTRTSDLQETLEYQTATSDVLKVISRSTFELNTVLQTVLTSAVHLCGADRAILYRYRDGRCHFEVGYNNRPEYEALERSAPIAAGPDTVVGRAMQEGRAAQILDAIRDPEYGPKDQAQINSARSMLGVPLLRDGELIGVLALARTVVEAFTERQIELVSTFADQAVIAIENARLLTEQQEALEQQTATAEVLQVINSSPGNLVPVFETILDKAHSLCGAVVGSLLIYDGEHFHAEATHGQPEEVSAILSRPFRPNTFLQRLVLGEHLVHIPDFKAASVREDHELTRGTRDATGIRTSLWVPLRKDGVLLGCISAFRLEVCPFSKKEVALLENFAAQAVIAMENARLLGELRQRTGDLQEALEYQTATSDVLKVISRSTFDLQPVLRAVAETAARLCAADQALLVRHENGIIQTVANFGFPPEYLALLNELGPHRLAVDAPMVTYRAITERRVVHIHDVAAVSGYAVEAIKLGQQRTSLGVPLLREGEPIGSILLARQRVEPFTERQIELVSTFADQAVIAIENTRLITEQQEALEQQTATAEVLQVINASPGNLAPVFDAMLEKAMRLCGIAFGMMTTFDGERFHPVCWRGLPTALSKYFAEGGGPSGSSGMHAQLVGGAPLVYVADMKDEEAYRSGYPARRALVDLGGARTGLAIALRKEGVLLGTFMLYCQEVRSFSDKEMALLQNFGAQAVIAIENARLLTEQREALEQQTATAEVLQVINASPGNLAPVFDAVLEKAIRLCDSAFGVLQTYDGHIMRCVAMRGLTPEQEALLVDRPPAPGQPTGRIAGGEDVVHLSDAREQDGYRAGFGPTRDFVDQVGARTAMWVALRKDKKLLGILTIFRREVRAFADKEAALVQNFAAQAVIAMENARLITEQREALEQQTATAEVLGVINANPGNLTPVFDTILNKAHRLCGASVGSLLVYEDGWGRVVATHGFPESVAELARQPARPLGLFLPLLHGERFVHQLDMKALEIAPDNEILLALTAHVGTGLYVPLRKDGTLLGMITAYRSEVRAFSDKEIALLESFAAQAVIAMENARLLRELQEALDEQTATAEVLRVINASPGNLAPVFAAMIDKAARLTQSEFGVLATYDGSVFHAFSSEQSAPETLNPEPGSALGDLVDGAPFIHIPDVMDTDAYRARVPSRVRLVDGFGARTCLWIPMRKDDALLGVLASYRREVRPFSDRQIYLLQNFAAQAVIAMENARLLNEVRQRQEELRITFENMGDGVAMFDETQHLVAWNGKFQEIFDLPDTLLEQHRTYEEHLRFLAARGDFGASVDTAEQVRALVASTGQPYGYERTRPDGRVIEIRRNPVADGGFVLMFSDITERKRSEAEIRAARDAAEAALRELKAAQANLIQAEKMASLGQLTAGIAHEIKNPLNFVNNFAALSVDLLGELKETAAPGFAALTDDQRAEIDDVSAMLTSNLEKITEHGKRADGIVKAMLEHSRGSSGERRTVDLNALIDEALNLAYHGARAQNQSFNITLERDFGEDLAPIEVNPQDITRVFLNIFSNGFYAATRRARDGGDAGFVPTLKVTTRDAGDALEIRVRDNGTGIPADIRDKLFQPFFTTKPTGEGTGLGLSITYDIVTQQHGGTIKVESEVNDYSEFTIRLPRTPG